MKTELAKEMKEHTYAIMNRVENKHWWYAGRRAILKSFLDRIVKSTKAEKTDLQILDVGCGTGANLEMLHEYGNAEGVDVSEDALNYCLKKNLTVRKGLAEELPFEDESFDITTALDVVEHLDNDITGLREMHRVLKKGGKSLIFVPAFMWLWGVQDDISHHRIRYTKKQIVERVKEAGFEIQRATYVNITFFTPILLGRSLMKLTNIKPESENNINISILNGILGKIFSMEKYWLNKFNFPFGVSIILAVSKN